MSRDPRAEMRSRIIRKLRSSEWMERHFAVSAHAEDVADAVMEMFPEVEREGRPIESLRWYPVITGEAAYTHTRFVLRTAPEPITEGDPT